MVRFSAADFPEASCEVLVAALARVLVAAPTTALRDLRASAAASAEVLCDLRDSPTALSRVALLSKVPVAILLKVLRALVSLARVLRVLQASAVGTAMAAARVRRASAVETPVGETPSAPP